MKFINFQAGCSATELAIAETDTPKIGDDEVLLKVVAAGVNRADTLQRQGHYPAPVGESEILGLEVSGTIDAIGKSVTDWKIGDKVFGLVPGGGYAEYCRVKASHLLPLPQNLSFQQAAGTAEIFLTAHQALFTIGQLQAEQTVLIHAGASGVGTAAIQLAKHLNTKIATTASSDEKLQLAGQLGADCLINYKTQDFAAELKAFSQCGANLIVDFIAGDYLAKNVNCAAVDGKIVLLAMLGGRKSEVDAAKLLGKRIQIVGSTLRNRSDAYKTKLIREFSAQFYSALEQGEIKPIIDTVYDWQDAGIAHQRLEHNDSMGKFILNVS